jgi:hypothetical protein
MTDFENNVNLPGPLTAAGRLLQSRTTEGTFTLHTAAPATTEELKALQVASQLYTDPEVASSDEYPSEEVEAVEPVERVELYDYERDGGFDAAGDSTRTLLRWVGHGALVPAGEIKLGEDGDRFNLTINMRGQKPTVTARNALEQAKEFAQESEVALQVSGAALLEAIKETYVTTAEVKPDKEAARAIAVVCMQLVTYYSQRESTGPSVVALTGAIRQNHPDILKDPQFRSTMKRFGNDPEKFKQDFANIPNLPAMIKVLPMVPAFHEFVETHAINTEEVFGDAL